MGNPPGWVSGCKNSASHGKVDIMAGLAAGVVSSDDVNAMPKQPSKMAMSLSNPATWTYIWAGLAAAYLVGIYLGMITIRRRGE